MAVKYKVTYKDWSCRITKPALRLKYIEGEVTTAQKETAGIAVFDELEQARNFVKRFDMRPLEGQKFGSLKIKRVKPIGRRKNAPIAAVYDLNVRWRHLSIKKLMSSVQASSLLLMPPFAWPKGTSLYNAVLVLDEVE